MASRTLNLIWITVGSAESGVTSSIPAKLCSDLMVRLSRFNSESHVSLKMRSCLRPRELTLVTRYSCISVGALNDARKMSSMNSSRSSVHEHT